MTTASAAIVVGLAGPSGGGKTTIATGLCERLANLRPVLLPLDAYYQQLTCAPADRSSFNFDAPDAVDWDLLIPHARALARGEAIERPVYRFDMHARDAHPVPAGPGGLIVIEGLYALYREEVRWLMGLRVFVTAGPVVRLERRMRRDVCERGRTRESVIEQVRAHVEPMYAKHVEPTRAFADLVLDGERPVDESVDAVVRALAPALAARGGVIS